MNFKDMLSRLFSAAPEAEQTQFKSDAQSSGSAEISPQTVRDSIYFTLRDFIEDHGLACLAKDDTTATLQPNGLLWIHLNAPRTLPISEEPGVRKFKTKHLAGLQGFIYILENPQYPEKPKLEVCAQVLTDSVMDHLGLHNPHPFEVQAPDFAFEDPADLRVIVISRQDIEAKNFSALLVLEEVLSDAATARHYRERLDICVSGYDEIKLELWEIPEVRDYIQALDEKWPYWLFFMSRAGLGLQFAMQCFVPPFLTREAFNQEFPRRMEQLFTKRWFPAMNTVADWAGFEEKDIRALTDSAVEYMFSGPTNRPPTPNDSNP